MIETTFGPGSPMSPFIPRGPMSPWKPFSPWSERREREGGDEGRRCATVGCPGQYLYIHVCHGCSKWSDWSSFGWTSFFATYFRTAHAQNFAYVLSVDPRLLALCMRPN